VREHTDFIVDLPAELNPLWSPLLAITGSRVEFDLRYPDDGETNVVRFLVADEGHSGSVLRSIAHARENLRTTREVVPREAWQALNDTYLFFAGNAEDGVGRRTRSRFLSRIVEDCQRVIGILDGTMRRDHTFAFMRLGRYVERADMTTRVLDVRAGRPTSGSLALEDMRWMSVLRSLSALQMYHRSTVSGVEGVRVVRFLLRDTAFPRSVAHCLNAMELILDELPRADATRAAAHVARVLLAVVPFDSVLHEGLHDEMDRLQVAIAAVHNRVVETYFSMALAPA
jgi:uncharacterized alpha-E superfamily protein